MKKIRNTAIALATAGALTLTAAPAMAQDNDNDVNDVNVADLVNLSSRIGDELDATDEQRAVFGSSKDFDAANDFTVLWYGSTVAAAATFVGDIIGALNGPAQGSAGPGLSSHVPLSSN